MLEVKGWCSVRSDLDRLMAERGLDALLVSGPAAHNAAMYYLANGAKVTETAILVKRRGEEPTLIVNPMERDEGAKSGLAVVENTRYDPLAMLNKAGGDRLRAAVHLYEAIFADLGVRGNVAVYGREEQGRALALAEAFNARQSGARLVGEFADSAVEVARRTKDAAEVGRIRAVGARTTAVVAQTAEFLSAHRAAHGELLKQNGTALTVGDVKRQIRVWLADRALDDPYGVIFAIGRDAGVPHSRGDDDQPIALGQTMVYDIFPCEAQGGYFFDFTRTWCLGSASPAALRVYAHVQETHAIVMAEIGAGASCRDLQRRACVLLETRGHPTLRQDSKTTKGYVHGLGHGLGLDVHEPPALSDYEGNDGILEPGCVFTIEPGLYYPDDGFGIRLEDTVWLNPATGRAEALADYSMDLVLSS